MKKATALFLSLAMSAAIFSGCGNSSDSNPSPSDKTPEDSNNSVETDNTPEKTYTLTVSGIGGSLNYIPVYIAEQQGWFKEQGLEIEEVLFTNGPVQMESLSSNGWDIGATGVGGVLSGVIGYDAIVVGASNTDDGTQYAFARNDHPIVQSGKGHNSINSEIYGDAESWKGASILCNTGTVLQYLLIKTLEGVGLSTNDVTFIAMDAPTAYSAFLAGEGDVSVLTGSSGTFNMLEDSANYTPVSSGTMAETGLLCNFVANKNSYADPEKYEAMKIFLSVYFKSLEWMQQNPEEAVKYLVDFNDESGTFISEESASTYLKADRYFSLEEAVDMINTKAEGQEYSVMEGQILDVLNFFIEFGNYAEGDDQKFLNHTDAKLLNDVLEMKQ